MAILVSRERRVGERHSLGLYPIFPVFAAREIIGELRGAFSRTKRQKKNTNLKRKRKSAVGGQLFGEFAVF